MTPSTLAATVGERPSIAERRWPPDPRTAGRARRFLTRHLELWGSRHLIESAELIASELVANAVRHGTAGSLRLLVALCGDVLTLTVSNRTPYVPLPPAELPGDNEESGRGLALVELLSIRWGHRPVGGVAANGTEVWAELAVAVPEVAP